MPVMWTAVISMTVIPAHNDATGVEQWDGLLPTAPRFIALEVDTHKTGTGRTA